MVGKVESDWLGGYYDMYSYDYQHGQTSGTAVVGRREYGLMTFRYGRVGPGSISVHIPKGLKPWASANVDDHMIHDAVARGDDVGGVGGKGDLFELRNKVSVLIAI